MLGRFSILLANNVWFVVVIVMLCIPWMLCVKPFLLWKQHEKEARERKLRGDVELTDVNQNPYQVFIDVNFK